MREDDILQEILDVLHNHYDKLELEYESQSDNRKSTLALGGMCYITSLKIFLSEKYGK